MIEHNVKRKKKALVTPNPAGAPVRVLAFDNGLDEAEGVVLQIKEFVKSGADSKYRDCAIFLRINALTRSLESAFVEYGVPFQIVKGFAFYERKEIGDRNRVPPPAREPAGPARLPPGRGRAGPGRGKVSLDRLDQFAIVHEIGLLEAAGRVGQVPEIKGKAATGLERLPPPDDRPAGRIELPPLDLIRLVLEDPATRRC